MSDDAGATAEPGPGATEPPTERYELPEIIPATVHEPMPTSPQLPNHDPAEMQRAAARAARPTTVPPTAPQPAPAPATPVAAPAAAQLRAPGRRPRVRRVTRVLRHIDPWSTFKVALVFSVVGYIVALTSGVLLWRVADSTGTLDNVERWFTQFGWETFELKGGEIFHNAWIIGLFGVVAATGGAVLLVTLFNLVSDIVGGVRMTVLEEEVVERTVSSTRRYVVRNVGPGAPTPASANWSVDDDPVPGEPTAPTPTAASSDWSVD